MQNDMAEKKLVESITSMDVDFAQWYTDVVSKAELMDYSSVKNDARYCVFCAQGNPSSARTSGSLYQG